MEYCGDDGDVGCWEWKLWVMMLAVTVTFSDIEVVMILEVVMI